MRDTLNYVKRTLDLLSLSQVRHVNDGRNKESSMEDFIKKVAVVSVAYRAIH